MLGFHPIAFDRQTVSLAPARCNVSRSRSNPMMKKVALVVTAIAVLALYPAAKLVTAQTQPSFLFVQSAKKIDYKDGVMTLYDVPKQTMFFTDRPNRVVGNLPTDRFVARWTTDKGPNGFASNPPNAADRKSVV